MQPIYLDNNATTPLLPAVWDAMAPLFRDTFGNPASAHAAGRRARQALEDARERVAHLLHAGADEVLFTSGATEANNLALFGLAGDPPGQIVGTPVEHPSVTEPLRRLGELGYTIEHLAVDSSGRIPPDALPPLLRPDTRLVTVQLANHETGSSQPVRSLAASTPHPFHCDATQAVGRIPVSFPDLGVTSLSLSAHKFHGPKGVGALILRRGARLRPLLWGGHQQHGRRPGTEAVALAVGLATALQLAHDAMDTRLHHIRTLRGRFFAALQAAVAPILINGSPNDGIPHTLNLSFPGCSADALLMNLDLAGVACSTGSACSSGSLLPSPVLQAMQLPPEQLRSALRFSFSALLSESDIDEASRRIAATVRRLRSNQLE